LHNARASYIGEDLDDHSNVRIDDVARLFELTL
jgi:hypothetical protein